MFGASPFASIPFASTPVSTTIIVSVFDATTLSESVALTAVSHSGSKVEITSYIRATETITHLENVGFATLTQSNHEAIFVDEGIFIAIRLNGDGNGGVIDSTPTGYDFSRDEGVLAKDMDVDESYDEAILANDMGT